MERLSLSTDDQGVVATLAVKTVHKTQGPTKHICVFGKDTHLKSLQEAENLPVKSKWIHKQSRGLVLEIEDDAQRLVETHLAPVATWGFCWSLYEIATPVSEGHWTMNFSSVKALRDYLGAPDCPLKRFFGSWETINNVKVVKSECEFRLGSLLLSNALSECVESIPGIFFKPEFVTPEEETHLMKFIYTQPWVEQLVRRVQHYGYRFRYEAMYIDETPDLVPKIPSEFDFLVKRFCALGVIDWVPDQLTINEYQPGQGIGFHVDVHSAFTEAVVVISLNSGLNMEFRLEEDDEVDFREVHLASRSLCIFGNEARYRWVHGIKSRKTDWLPDGSLNHRDLRVSLTFRKLNWDNQFKCSCPWPRLCDTQNPESHNLPERL